MVAAGTENSGAGPLRATFEEDLAIFNPDGEKTARSTLMLFTGIAHSCSAASAVAPSPMASKVSSHPEFDETAPDGPVRETWSRTARTTSSNGLLRTSTEGDEPSLRIATMRSPIEIEPHR